jgi:alpha-tubulin suppressor-like RCC1 family protein
MSPFRARLGRGLGVLVGTIATSASVSFALGAQPAAAECSGPCSAEARLTGLAHPPSWAKGRLVHFIPESPVASAYRQRRPAAPVLSPGLPIAPLVGFEGEGQQIEPLLFKEGTERTSVQRSPKIHLILWGENFRNTTEGKELQVMLEELLGGLTSSGYNGIRTPGYQGILTQYFDREGRIAPSISVDVYNDEREHTPAPTEVSRAKLEKEIESAIEANKSNGWAAETNAQFMVVTAPGTSYEKSFPGGFCAYHQYLVEKGIVYDFIPYQGDTPFTSCITIGDPGGNPVVKTSKAASHEYAEAATDPQLRQWQTPEGAEIGDLCQNENDLMLADGGWVQPLADNHLNTCSHEDPEPPYLYTVTRPASSVLETSGTLNGLVNTEEAETQETSYDFQYGLTTSYGNTVPASPLSATGRTDVMASQAVTGLSPDTTYHYRIVATNTTRSTGKQQTTAGDDATFTTAGPMPTVANVQPNVGPEAGGTAVTITGTNLSGVTSVKFGSVSSPHVTFNSPSAITAISPAGSGTVDVTVAINSRTSETSVADRFAYRRGGVPVAWGDNESGQLGNGTTTSTTLPGETKEPSEEAITAAGGEAFSLALLRGGTVRAFGNNSAGQLGNDSTTNSSVPVPVCEVAELLCKPEHYLSQVGGVAAGGAFSLALLHNQTVRAWGNNSSGQLGNDSTTNSPIPVPVCEVAEPSCSEAHRLSKVVAVAAGANFSLALLENGTVRAWGNNSSGQLGNDSTTNSRIPVPVCAIAERPCSEAHYLSGVVAIAAGSNFSLALLKNGTVRAWGNNSSGQLGNDSTINSRIPVPVCAIAETSCKEEHYLGGASAIAAGASHSLALLAGGTERAWGNDSSGQLGNDSTTNSSIPVPVCAIAETSCKEEHYLGGVTAIAAGRSFSLALLKTDTAMSWGENAFGQLGTGNKTPSDVPVSVEGLTAPSSLTGGGFHSLAIGVFAPTVTNVQPNIGPEAGGTRVTVSGTHLIGTTSVRFGAAYSTNVTVNSASSLIAVSPPGTGRVNVVVTTADGTTKTSSADEFTYKLAKGALAWGENGSGQLGNGEESLSSLPGGVHEVSEAATVAAGEYHALALLENGSVRAWGRDTEGQLGNGATETSRKLPVPVCTVAEATCKPEHYLSEVTAVAAGQAHSLALRSAGNVVAWGSDTDGQLGNGSTINSSVPTEVQGLPEEPVIAIAAGYHHSLALLKSGKVYAWGDNEDGELGTGTTENSTKAVPVQGLPEEATAISAGADHSLAVLKSGKVMAWGENAYGELGDGESGESTDKHTPVEVKELSEVSSVSAGYEDSAALLRSGKVKDWGMNLAGELGNGTALGKNVPTEVSSLSGVTALSAGGFHDLALLSNSTVMAWGDNMNGQLGIGRTSGPETCQFNVVCSKVPLQVKELQSTAAVSAGTRYSLAAGAIRPSITNVQPDTGPEAGGTTVVISGSDLAGASAVDFGSTPASSFSVSSADSITAVSPAGGQGTVDVTVTTPGGTSATQASDHFTYSPARTVLAWGYNVHGQLGDGTTTGPEQCRPSPFSLPCSKVPVEVKGISTATAVTGGSDFSYALLRGGNVESWGGDETGELANEASSDVPVPVKELTSVSALAAGEHHGLSLLSNGGVKSWGAGTYGQLGNREHTFVSYVPVSVEGINEATAVAAGGFHSLALLQSGQVMTWGDNLRGELGIGTTSGPETCIANGGVPCSNVALTVPSLNEVNAIAAGESFSLALLRSGHVMAWGENRDGQLGDGTEATSDVPVEVKGLTEVVAIAAAGNKAFALLRSGKVMAWGQGAFGELGDGGTANSLVPVEVKGLTEATAIAAGYWHGMALLRSGKVVTWGENQVGQLGTGNESNALVPAEVPGLSGVAAIGAGDFHSLVIGP